MTTRITGTNSGLDVDTIVTESLATEQSKIDKAYQSQKVYEYEQEQLKTIVSDAASFYDKYLDILTSGNLFSSSTYETATFTSSSDAVSAVGYAGADVTDYSVSVNSIAQKAKTTLSEDYFNNAIDAESGVFSLQMINSDGTTDTMYIDLPIENGEIDMSSLAKTINSALKTNGIGATAKYSEFAKGIVIESSSYGEDVSFGVAVESGTSVAEEGSDPEGFNYSYVSGQNAKGTITKGDYVYQIDSASNIITVDNVQFTLYSATTSSDTSEADISHLDATDKDNKTTLESLDGTTTIVSQNERSVITKNYTDGITLKTVITAETDEEGNVIEGENTVKTSVSGNLSHLAATDSNVTVFEDDDSGITTIMKQYTDSDNNITTKTTTINSKTNETTTTYVHDGVQIQTVTVTETVDGKETSTTTTTATGDLDESVLGDDYKTIVESSDGKTRTTIINSLDESGNNKTTLTTIKSEEDGSSVELITTNTENSDGTTSVTNETTASEPVTLSGKTDVSSLKDTIVNFINDYNTLMQEIDTKLWETRDTDYMPLTDSQKDEMSDSEIEAWETKAKTGLLRGDSDLQRIQSSMKSAMSSLMSGTGLTLESIGITPVDNYTTKNGMYTIDEDTLTDALESNSEEIKDLFTRSASGDDKGGVLVQLKSVLYSEVKSSASILSQRIGFEGTSTESNNTLSNYITAQKKLISELQDKYDDKEDALYTKYSNLEVALEKLNAQSSSLSSLLGTNS